jgi:phospholipid transport system substrate-binding protein
MRPLHIVPMVIVLLAFVGGAAATTPSPMDFLKAVDEKLDPLLEDTDKNKAEILRILNEMLDYKQLCRASLGKRWDTRSKAERQDFCATLKALTEKNSVKRLRDAKDHKIEYESEEVLGAKASVVTRITPEEPRAPKSEIEYELQKAANSWRVTDMVTDGVSLVNTYRSEFGRIIAEDGWDVLMKRMKDKLAEGEETEAVSQP